MLNIRKNLFETNSSSVHALVIPKNQTIHVPKTVYLRYEEYGWEFSTYGDTINYLYTACVDAGQEFVNKLIKYLKRKGVKQIEEMGGQDVNFGIDHSYEVPLDELFENKSLLDRFLFGTESYIQTGNDNDEECPDESDYDESIDVLMKYN